MRINTHVPILLSVLLVSLCGCNFDNDKVVRAGKPTIYTTESDDAQMQEAMNMGKKTFPEFMKVLTDHDSTCYNFAIKVHYDDGSQREFLWLGEPTVENGKIYGVVDNDPEYTTQVKEGQKVAVDTSLISDWNYTNGNKLIGGYTVKLLRNRMSPAERAEFDKSTGLVIE